MKCASIFVYYIIVIATVARSGFYQVSRKDRIPRPDSRIPPMKEGLNGYGCWFSPSETSGLWIQLNNTKITQHKLLESLYKTPYTLQEMRHIRNAKKQAFDSIFFVKNFNAKNSELVVFHEGNCADIPVYQIRRCNSTYIMNVLTCQK